MSERSPEDVLRDHLELRQRGKLEEDIRRNYAEDVVLLTSFGTHHGHEGVRELAHLLESQIPGASFEYRNCCVAGDLGFLEWTARCERGRVEDGADSYCIRDGKIVGTTIHYTVVSPGESERPKG